MRALLKEKGVTTTVMAAVIVVVLVIAGSAPMPKRSQGLVEQPLFIFFTGQSHILDARHGFQFIFDSRAFPLHVGGISTLS